MTNILQAISQGLASKKQRTHVQFEPKITQDVSQELRNVVEIASGLFDPVPTGISIYVSQRLRGGSLRRSKTFNVPTVKENDLCDLHVKEATEDMVISSAAITISAYGSEPKELLIALYAKDETTDDRVVVVVSGLSGQTLLADTLLAA